MYVEGIVVAGGRVDGDATPRPYMHIHLLEKKCWGYKGHCRIVYLDHHYLKATTAVLKSVYVLRVVAGRALKQLQKKIQTVCE